MKKISNDVFESKFNRHRELARNYIDQRFGTKDSRATRRFFKTNIQCSLCNALISDARDSHNALPISELRCCEKCNVEKVIPARLNLISSNLIYKRKV